MTVAAAGADPTVLPALHRRVLLAGFGLLLLQVAWMLAVPPFAASDEYDHAYRAAAVARGEWVAPPTDATRGTGALVHVPRDIVEAAGAECRRLPYTKKVDCEPQGDGEMVTVASGAGRYNPAFYFLIGAAASPFHGTAALYVMRVAGALLCLGLLVAALYAARGRTTWMTAGIVLVLTPVALFSTAMAAPNGIEMAAATAFWTSLLALARRGAGDVAALPRTPLLGIAALSGITLATVRSLGPLWVVLACGAVLLVSRVPGSPLRGALPRTRGALLAAAGVALSIAASLSWTLSQRSLTVGLEDVGHVSRAEVIVLCLEANVVWLFQSIAAFPTRDVFAPALVYVLGVLTFFAALSLLPRLPRPHRRSALLVLLATVSIPTVVTYRTYETYSFAWQGRYTLPLAFGFGLLWAAGLDEAGQRLARRLLVGFGMAHVLMHTVSIGSTMTHERAGSPSVNDGSWWLLPVPVVCLIGAVGAIATVLAAAEGLPTRLPAEVS